MLVASAGAAEAPARERATCCDMLSWFNSGCPPPDARLTPPSSTTRVGPVSTSMFPAAAVAWAGLAFESARANAELALAFTSVGVSLPRDVAT